MEVMLCSLDGERCQECRSPVDPGLLKVLQLAQLSMEWLLHCQEVLSLNLHAVEERLEAERKEQEQLLEQQSQQEERVKALEEELVLKGKLVSDLQSKLLLCSHKCPICKKGFFTPQFLRSHMERRHPEDHESQLQSDREMKSQINNLKMEISGLRERNVQLQQNLDLKTAQEKRLESELDHFKAEEMARFERVQTDSARSQEQLLLKLEQQLKEQEKRLESELGHFKAEEMARFERVQTDSARSQEQLLLKLEQQLKEQDESWKSILHQSKEHHDSEMNNLSFCQSWRM
ncbi:unnamed protein product [Pleuronectes platessa]|uniref:C2H2-type domain-containing protein n=1 Tax=Pleuronectes platessa TaxID=8262 RepID=A0A9N7V386_PLEPL|nr:unnamed protein product [Pleuronectes platessa]